MNWRVQRGWEISKEAITTHKEEKIMGWAGGLVVLEEVPWENLAINWMGLVGEKA